MRRIADHVARVYLAKKLQDTGEESFYHGPKFVMNIRKDEFVHFTYEDRANQILDDGKFKANPPYKKFGIEGVQAVSTVWGHLSPGVQYKHLQSNSDEPLVGIVFTTMDEPDIGYPEEVIWKYDVSLRNAKVVSFSKAKGLLRNTPEKVPEGTVVRYYR